MSGPDIRSSPITGPFGYHPFDQSGVEHSVGKLLEAAQDVLPYLPANTKVYSYPCQTEDESLAYRCRCAFQLVLDERRYFHYALRRQKQPILLQKNCFPIATRKIQEAMKRLLDQVLNHAGNEFEPLRSHLTSVAFASTWNDSNWHDLKHSCIVTLLYGRPLDSTGEWTGAAKLALSEIGVQQIHGRSKGILLSASQDHAANFIVDYLTIRASAMENERRLEYDVLVGGESTESLASSEANNFQVVYHKPETAFHHPNGAAMKQALGWLLSRISVIAATDDKQERPRLLEMYCGCGAHTVPLAKSGLLGHVTAVEVDQRLVDACRQNMVLNGLEGVVTCHAGDAGTWAKNLQLRRQTVGTESLDILLVDPPRMGLDDRVCQLACRGSFSHFLYISCGRQALLRDLQKIQRHFEVVHCAVLDLFPRLDAVETLVHLRRRDDDLLI